MRAVHGALGVATINPKLLTAAERLQHEGFLHREDTTRQILALKEGGHSIKEIVRRTRHSRKLVRQAVRGVPGDIFRVRQSSLDAYLPVLLAEWEAGVDTGVKLVLPHFSWCRSSCCVQHAGAEEGEARAAIHRALQHLDSADVAFDWACGPGHDERGVDGVEVAAQAGCEAPEHSVGRGSQHVVQAVDRPAPEELVQPFRPADGGGQLRLVRQKSRDEQPLLRVQPRPARHQQARQPVAAWHWPDRSEEVPGGSRYTSNAAAMAGGPLPNNRRATPKAEGYEFTPELAGVAAPLAPASAKEGLERVKDAVAGGLLPEGRLTEPQPAMDGFAIGPKLGGDARDCRAKAAQPRGLLIAQLAPFSGGDARLLDLGQARRGR